MNDIAQNNVGMIDEKEAMRMIKVSSRMTISKYTKLYNFPKPIRTHPKQYLQSEVVQWILNGGINQKSY
ncbi:AlpA family transcriptional regulator [Salmonella enterica subsp. diarizonae]|nr:AlpA family transcriptional regulator [Salmonella enterica subsp. diarizonae]